MLKWICMALLVASARSALAQDIHVPDSMHQQPVVAKTQDQELLELRVEHVELQRKLDALIRDTADLHLKISSLESQESKLKQELNKYKTGIFFGVGFGFNYFTSSPPQYYVKSDSTMGEYGNQSGMSFILSGFMAYKIHEKHSVIFNVPLGDITNREEFKIGLFNQKMAGGIGYGRNMGSVSMIFIVNISPYDIIQHELLEGEKFEMEKYTPINTSDYPSTTVYSPSFTIGFSYNFQAGNKLNNFVGY